MGITNGAITVGTAVTLITHANANPGTLHISNLDNTDTVFLGNATVAVNAGHALAKSSSEDFTFYPGQIMYAISSKAGHTISYMLSTP